MISRKSGLSGRPITRSGRRILSGCVLLVAVVLGFAISTALYQLNREAARSSALLGSLLCGPQQRIDDVPGSRRARRTICRDELGVEVSARNNAVPFLMALPFILVLAVPGVWFAMRANMQDRRS